MRCPYCESINIVKAGFKQRVGGEVQSYRCKDCGRNTTSPAVDADQEIVEENVLLAAQKQRLQDINRIERKSFRESVRINNALEEYTQELIKEIRGVDLSKFKQNYKIEENKNYFGIIHLTDAHFNEIVHGDEISNRYDFRVASKRLQKFIDHSCKIFSAYEIRNIFVAVTGDMLNSDRRLDELLHAASNRAKGSLLAEYLLEQVYIDLITRGFIVTTAWVSGNESRFKDIQEHTEHAATENYDFTIHEHLKIMFRNVNQIEFVSKNFKEQVFDVNGFKILLLHGEGIKSDKNIQSIFGKYALEGTQIDYLLFGHLHSTQIGDFHARGGSLVGANNYSKNALHFQSSASQNAFVVSNKKEVNAIRICLDNVEGYEGYDIIDKLEAYSSKSARATVSIIQEVII